MAGDDRFQSSWMEQKPAMTGCTMSEGAPFVPTSTTSVFRTPRGEMSMGAWLAAAPVFKPTNRSINSPAFAQPVSLGWRRSWSMLWMEGTACENVSWVESRTRKT